MLTASGITPEAVSLRGYETISDKKRLAEVGITPAGRRVPGLLIPLRDVRGSTWGYQFRPDSPRTMMTGRVIRYESPTNQRNGIDVPPGVGPQLGDPAIPLFVTEGSKKADCAAVHGLCCVALLGVWSWRGTNTAGGKTALPDWADVALNGRRVILAYDGDVQRKEPVRAAMHALAKYLAIKGARIEYLHLPDTGTGKVGLDDYLIGHTVEELWALVQPIAPPPQPPAAEPTPPKAPLGSIDGAALLDDIKAWFQRFIIVTDPDDLNILALWTVHTHLVKELRTSPRLQVDSVIFGSGKTTVLDHLERLCLNPVQAAQLSSPALIPRMLETWMRTILLDEIDRSLRKDRPGVEDLIAILNSGYRHGASRPVLVQVPGGWEPREMPTFAPVAMAGNSPNLPDDTTSRSIRVLLMPDITGAAEDSDWEMIEEDAEQLRDRIIAWADTARTEVKGLAVDLPDKCRGRSREKWRPLKRIAALAGGRWPDITDALIVKSILEDEAEREAGLKAQPPGVVVLTDLLKVWPDDPKLVPTRDLVAMLITHNPDYWGPDSPYGKALTDTRLGRLLSQAAKVTSQRPGGTGPRGYHRSQFERAWCRLGLTPPIQPGKPDEPGGPGDDGPGDDHDGTERSQVRHDNRVHRVNTEAPLHDECLDCGRDLTGVWNLPVVRMRGYCTPCFEQQQRRA
jgi:hypothetical protein